MAAEIFDTNFSPFSVIRYVAIPYGIAQLFANTVVSFFDATIMTDTALFSFLFKYVKRNAC